MTVRRDAGSAKVEAPGGLSVLAYAPGGPGPAALRSLLAGPALGLPVQLTTDPSRLAAASPFAVVLVAAEQPLPAEVAGSLEAFVARGGGLVTVGATPLAWTPSPALTALTGWRPAGRAPLTEVVVRPHPGHPVTERLDPELMFEETILLSAEPPDGAVPLLTVSWRFRDQVVGYSRRHGAGTAVHLGLGTTQRTIRDPVFAQLLRRCLRHAAGLVPAPPARIGLLGYGAIGREHGTSITEVLGLELAAICDRSSPRRALAGEHFKVRTYPEAGELLADPQIDLVVVGTPPSTHAGAVMAALEAGKHVVCEKPLALNLEEVDRMLEKAEAGARSLTVYQNRRWDPDFVALKGAVASGSAGEIFYMESFIGGYSHPCQFWHSHEPVSGGTMFDWGSHYFDWMLQLLPGQVTRIAAQAHKRVWHDVTNSDQVRVDLTLAGGRQAVFLQSDIAAALKPKWYLLGTEGAIVGDWRWESVRSRGWGGDLVEESLAPAEAPATVSVFRPNREGLSHREELALPGRRSHAFYRNLADHLTQGEPLAVLPEEARRAVAVMAAATRSIAAGGRQLSVRI